MADKDYYNTLGIKRDAGDKEIKQAYRRLARKYHPDVNPGDKSAEEHFKRINEAYEVLSDKEKRQKYDNFGDQWQYADQFAQAGQQQSSSRHFDNGGNANNFYFEGGDLGSLFEDLLGGRRSGRTGTSYRQNQARRGQDIESPLEVTLEEAYQGTSRTISLQVNEPCPSCQGSGQIQNIPCSTCHGSGATVRMKRLEVKIPAGVNNGSRVRIAGKGQPGYGGTNGDLYLIISVKPHPLFERKGDNLHVVVDIPLTIAMLGGEIQVPTLKNKLSLRIPPETQNGRVFRLARQGMPHLGSSTYGDIMAKANITLPSKLSDEEKDLFRQLSKLRPV